MQVPPVDAEASILFELIGHDVQSEVVPFKHVRQV